MEDENNLIHSLTIDGSGTGALDLHVLGAPLAFTLSQDQTLQKDERVICIPETEVSGK